MNWTDRAICRNDDHPEYWVSYNLQKIEYAKAGCIKCPVQKECISTAGIEDEVFGVIAGLSEFDRRMHLWKKVTDINGNNWE